MLKILKRIWLALVLLAIFSGAKFVFPQSIVDLSPESPEPVLKYFYYLIQIGFWLTSATFISQLLKIFFWEGVVSRSIKGTAPQLLVDLSVVFIYIIAIAIIIGHVFQQPLTGFWATSSVVALVIGLALRNIIFDLFTGLAVNIEKSYKTGDWVQVYQRIPEQNVTGEVIEINWRTTRIKTEENTLIVIPNSIMSTLVVINYWHTGYPTRLEVKFCIDFSVPAERVRRIVMAAAKEALLSDGFLSNPEPEVLIDDINEMGVAYNVRYWIKVWRHLSPAISRDIIQTAILNHLRRAGITPAYPKEDIYYDKMPVRQLDSALIGDRKELLRGVELFESLNDVDLEELAEAMNQIFYRTEETIIYAGDDGSSMYILLEGLCDVFIENEEIAQSVKVAQLKPGQFFGEMSLLTGEPRSATIIAATDSLVYEIKKEHIATLFEKRPEVIIMVSTLVADRKIHNQKISENLTNEELIEQTEETKKQLIRRIKSFFTK